MATVAAVWLGIIVCIALIVSGAVVGAIALYEKRTIFVIKALHRDESGAVQGRLRAALNILFRLLIIAFVGENLWTFAFLIWFWLPRLAHPFDGMIVFALFGGVIAPGFALVAIVLAAANKYLLLAALSADISQWFFLTSCC